MPELLSGHHRAEYLLEGCEFGVEGLVPGFRLIGLTGLGAEGLGFASQGFGVMREWWCLPPRLYLASFPEESI